MHVKNRAYQNLRRTAREFTIDMILQFVVVYVKMKSRQYLACCLFFAFGTGLASADTGVGDVHWTLEAALTRASNANPEIATAEQELQQSRARTISIALPPLTGVSSTLVSHDVPGGVGVYQQADLALSQDLPAPRQLRAERASAEADVLQTLVSLIAIRRDVRLRAIDAFYQVATAQDARDIERSDLALTRTSRDIAKARAAAGDVAQLDVIRAQADVDRATVAELNAEKDLSLAKLALGQLLGLPSPQTISVNVSSTLSHHAGSAGNTHVSNTLAQYQYDATQRQINALVNRARFVQSPSYSLSAGVQAVRSIRPSAIAYGPSMNLTVHFPVVDHGTVRGAVAEAEATRGVAQARLAAQTAEYQTAVQTRIAQLSSASERLLAAKASLNGTQTAQRLTEVGYRRGQLGLTDVLSARGSFLQARTAVNQASIDEMRASAELTELRSPPLIP